MLFDFVHKLTFGFKYNSYHHVAITKKVTNEKKLFLHNHILFLFPSFICAIFSFNIENKFNLLRARVCVLSDFFLVGVEMPTGPLLFFIATGLKFTYDMEFQ